MEFFISKIEKVNFVLIRAHGFELMYLVIFLIDCFEKK